MAPLISIILPTLNAAKYLNNALASFASQTYRNFELLVVDGNSSDKTLEIADQFSKDITLHIIIEKIPGVYHAMNTGVQHAKGQWLFFIGADDKLMDENVLFDIYEYAMQTDVHMIYGDVMLKNQQIRFGGKRTLDQLLFEQNICHQSIFYHREVFSRLGYYNDRYPIWADWDMNIRIFKHTGLKTQWIDRLIAEYNERSGISKSEDEVFGKELPKMIRLKYQNQIGDMNSKMSYKIGQFFFGWIDYFYSIKKNKPK